MSQADVVVFNVVTLSVARTEPRHGLAGNIDQRGGDRQLGQRTCTQSGETQLAGPEREFPQFTYVNVHGCALYDGDVQGVENCNFESNSRSLSQTIKSVAVIKGFRILED